MSSKRANTEKFSQGLVCCAGTSMHHHPEEKKIWAASLVVMLLVVGSYSNDDESAIGRGKKTGLETRIGGMLDLGWRMRKEHKVAREIAVQEFHHRFTCCNLLLNFHHFQPTSSSASVAAAAEARAILRCMKQGRGKIRNTVTVQPDLVESHHVSNDHDWASVFVDGAYSYHNNAVGCGGIVRAIDGSILEGFMFHLSTGDSITAEIWGCLMGLKRAWDLNLRRVAVFCDSREAVNLIQSEASDVHDDYNLIVEVQSMLQRAWTTKFTVIDRSENGMADTLAKKSLPQGVGLHLVNKEILNRFTGG